jgi:hypothetical protein
MLSVCVRCGWELHQDFGWVDTFGELTCSDGVAHQPSKASKVVTNSLQKSA